jgi:tRNA (mo5U34)-methyltransferase
MTKSNENISLEDAKALIGAVRRWHHKFEILPGLVTPGSYDPEALWSKLQLNSSISGRRVLDIGASDGFFTLRIGELGGDVTAVDFRSKDRHGFGVMETLTGRKFAYEHANIFDLDVDRLGRFDLVLFLGVLYHLPDMMRAFQKLRALCSGTLMVETHCETALSEHIAVARYYKGASLAGDLTNFWSPNRLCVLDMLSDAGFEAVRDEVWSDRMFVEARASNDPMASYKMDVAYGRIYTRN